MGRRSRRPLDLLSVALLATRRSEAQTNLLQNPDFATQTLADWTATPSSGYSAADPSFAHVWCFEGSCGTLTQDLGSSLVSGATYQIGYHGYCRSTATTPTTSDACWTVISLGSQSFNDTLEYLSADPAGSSSAWPSVSHTLVWQSGQGTVFKLATEMDGAGALWYAALMSVVETSAPAASTSSGTASSAATSGASSSSASSLPAGTSASSSLTTSSGTSTPGSAGDATLSPGKHMSHDAMVIAVGSALGGVILCLIGGGLFFHFRRRPNLRSAPTDSLVDELKSREGYHSAPTISHSSSPALHGSFHSIPQQYGGYPELQASAVASPRTPHPVHDAQDPDMYY